MLQLHSFIFPFSVTCTTRAHWLSISRTLSTFRSSYWRLLKRQKFKDHSSCACRSLKLHETPIIRNQHAPSSCSAVISSRSNIHISQIFKNRPSYLTTRRNMSYSSEQRGSLYNDDYRLYIKDSNGAIISAMHDIPLK